LWAQKAAKAGMEKAMYAVGYFLEVGIGTTADMQQ
jgi:TPR repeat protein